MVRPASCRLGRTPRTAAAVEVRRYGVRARACSRRTWESKLSREHAKSTVDGALDDLQQRRFDAGRLALRAFGGSAVAGAVGEHERAFATARGIDADSLAIASQRSLEAFQIVFDVLRMHAEFGRQPVDA